MEKNIIASEMLPVSLESELKQSYLDYAMSVIVGRALPDVRDGLKPVHRRVLYAMYQLGNDWQKPYKKSARVVGDVIGKYHPHGELAVYDAIVRMAQTFSMRYIMIDGQGNFGSVDGDSPAAMRYTEVRMSKFTANLLADIDKETVDFSLNYDESELIPDVLPTQIPNLLVNGTSGIAVGMATNIPPHNLTEVINACLALNANPAMSVEELMQYLPGPDFPTAGIIYGRAGIKESFLTGRGRIIMRGRAHVESSEKSSKEKIIITELPYQVNKARLVERIADLVREKKLEGITALRDESDKQGMRVVIELKIGQNSAVMLNSLYVNTQLQSSFGVNMVGLIDGQPKLLTLKELLAAFLAHRREVVTRRTIFELRKAQARAHLLSGLAIALTNIEAVIQLIKNAANPPDAKNALMTTKWQVAPDILTILLDNADNIPDGPGVSSPGLKGGYYFLSAEQAQAILDMRLQRLTALEHNKIIAEYQELQIAIANFKEILTNPEQLIKLIQTELEYIKEQFGDSRLTEIVQEESEFNEIDLVTEEDLVVTLSHAGYLQAQPLSLYKSQRRGGKGKFSLSWKRGDVIEYLVIASTHDTVLCFSNLGKVYWLKVYEFTNIMRNGAGRPIVNFLPLEDNEKIQAILPVRECLSDQHLVLATSNGMLKKMSLRYFAKPRSAGIIVIKLNDGDKLIGAEISNGQQDIMLFSDAGKVVRFAETKIRVAGRKTFGVRGILLKNHSKVVSVVVVDSAGEILTTTTNGYGNRTPVEKYRLTARGGQGVGSIKTGKRNGAVIGAVKIDSNAEVMLITNKGIVVRTPVNKISLVGRNTQGVKLINLSPGDALVKLEKVVPFMQEEDDIVECADDTQ